MIDWDSPDQMSVLYNYMEPFSNECRAFGRLREAGQEELAVQCFGYVLLDDDNERAMMNKFGMTEGWFNGDGDNSGSIEGVDDNRLRFLGKKSGRPPPYRCIVKAFGQGTEEKSWQNKMARKMLGDIIKFQKLGIIDIDFAFRQVIDGKLCDFSTAITIPHVITSPELNPELSPGMLELMRKETFRNCMNDYLAFDDAVYEWNLNFEEEMGRRMPIQAWPEDRACFKVARYNLRRKVRKPLYTLVDPSKYGWRIPQFGEKAAKASTQASKTRHSGRCSKPRRRKLTARPDPWHFKYADKDEDWAEETRWKWGAPFNNGMAWRYKDGMLFPIHQYCSGNCRERTWHGVPDMNCPPSIPVKSAPPPNL